MKKLTITTLISTFIIQSNLYCFDLLEDAFDFIEDIAKLVGIVLMIVVVMYFIKKFLKDENTSGKMRDYDNNRRMKKRCYDDEDDYYYDDDYEDEREYRNRRRRRELYDERDKRSDISERSKRKNSIINDDQVYEYDMRDYERREKKLPGSIDPRENDPRYEKVYELKPEYRLKSEVRKKK